MKTRNPYFIAAGLAISLLMPFSVAHAQLGGLLNSAGGSGSSGSSGGALGNLSSGLGGSLGGNSAAGGLGSALTGGSSSLLPSSTGNVAGVLQFCIRNNYLGGGDASSVKDTLMSKLGGNASSDSGFSSGSKGVIDAGGGKTLDLSGGGLKQQMTKQLCDKVLSQAKSML